MDGRQLGLAALDDGQNLAVTTRFAEVNTGLVKEGTEMPVRCELLAVARAPQAAVAAAVVGVADKLERAKGVLPAQPGVLLPNIVSALDEASDITVSHGMLIAPYLWGGPSPQVQEEKRLTLALQIVMLTDAEYAYAVDEGVAAVQQAVAEQGIDILDWTRADS